MLDKIYKILKNVHGNNRLTSALSHISNITDKLDDLINAIEDNIEKKILEKNEIIDEICAFLQSHKSTE